MVVSKLLQEETYDEAFEIIESTNKFNDRDTKSLIGQLENIAEIETYKERAEKLIDSLKNK